MWKEKFFRRGKFCTSKTYFIEIRAARVLIHTTRQSSSLHKVFSLSVPWIIYRCFWRWLEESKTKKLLKNSKKTSSRSVVRSASKKATWFTLRKHPMSSAFLARNDITSWLKKIVEAEPLKTLTEYVLGNQLSFSIFTTHNDKSEEVRFYFSDQFIRQHNFSFFFM